MQLQQLLGWRFGASTGTSIATEVRRSAKSLEQLTKRQLNDCAEGLRDDLTVEPANHQHLVTGFALAYESLRRTSGIRLYDVQLLASYAISRGHVAELATGEGKTFAATPAVMLGALRGQAVHVATPNSYLAERDFKQLRPAFDLLGISSGLLSDCSSPEEKRKAYSCEVTYGTGYEFGFDYLRDQLAYRNRNRNPLGQDLLARFAGDSEFATMQRGHHMAIIDEVDNVLIDDAGSPLILSEAADENADDADACQLAHQLAQDLECGEHYEVGGAAISLTELGNERVHDSGLAIPFKQLHRPWGEYIQQALRALLLFQRDVNYVVDDGEIRIVDGSTGRIFSDRSWENGLHQAVEAKECVAITSERKALAQITRQRYYQMYDSLSGMTGTANGCEREFDSVYKMQVTRIPCRLPCRRTVNPIRAFASSQAKWASILAEVKEQRAAGRAVLVGTRTIAESELLAELLESKQLPFQLLNGRQDAEEAAIISQAGRSGAITIATNLAGRGTDIQLEESVKQCGGMHVIVSEPHELARIDRQLVGRCARQGDPGSTTTFVSAEDHLIQQHAQWLIRPIRKNASRNDELRIDLTSRIRAIQANVARRESVARMELMRRDLQRESLLAGIQTG